MEILRCIELMRSPNISQLANMLGKDRNRVKSHLHKLKAEGYLNDRYVLVKTPFNRMILCHEYRVTRRGKRLLHEDGPVPPLLRCCGSRSARNLGAEPDIDGVAWFLLPRGESDSEVNYYRAKQAADILHAFSLAQIASRSRQG